MKKIFLFLTVFIMSMSSFTFAAANWPPTNDDYVYDWRTNVFSEEGWIVHYDGKLYECLARVKFDGTWWNPANLLTAPNLYFAELGVAKRWIPCIGAINQGEYILHNSALYQCNTATNSSEWVSANFDEICNADLTAIIGDPCEVPNVLPDNYVGYWYDNEQTWSPGWIGVDASTGLVYKCIATTNPNGGESPTSQYGHWWSNGGAWNAPPVSLGSVEDLLNIDGVTISAWDDLRKWPMGAIVEHEGKYYFYFYNSSIIYTTKGAGQEPGTEAGFDFWSELTLNKPVSVAQTATDQLNYFVQDGYLMVNSSEQVSIQLYNFTGQIVATAAGNSIKLPQLGVYIAKINAGGKIVTVKVLK